MMLGVNNCLLLLAAATVAATDPAREGVEEILHDFSLILPSGMEDYANGAGSSLGVDSLLGELVSAIGGGLPDAVLFFLLAFGAAVAIGLASLCPSELSPSVRGGVTVVAGGALLLSVLPLSADLAAALDSLGGLFSGVSALLASLAALGGGGAVAAASAAGTSLTLTLFGGLCGALLPLCSVMLFLGVVSSIGGTASPLLATVRGWFTRGVGIITALIGGLFSLQTAVSAIGDSATLRAIRYAATGTIPVVGGAVSGALSTLAGGVGYASHIIGGGGVAAMLTLALAPLVRLLLYRLALAAARLVADSLPDGGSLCLSSLAAGLDSLIAVYSLATVIYLFETVVTLIGVSSLI